MMRKFLLLSMLLMGVTYALHAQNSVAKITYEQAEEAFEKGDYKTTLSKLDETQKMLGSVNPKIMYLRIQAQNKLFLKDPLADYSLLESLRRNCNFYLQEYESISGIEEKYKEVYLILDGLKAYPKNRAEFDTARQVRINQEQEKKRQQEEQQRLQQQQAVEAQKKAEQDRKEYNKYNAGVLSFSGGRVAKYGISLDFLSKGVGLSMDVRAGLVMSTKMYSYLYTYKPTGDLKSSKMTYTMGINHRIVAPVWAYATVGFGILNTYNVYEKYDGADYVKNVYVPITSENKMGFANSMGVIVRAGRVLVFKTGFAWTNLTNREWTYGIGFNLYPKR